MAASDTHVADLLDTVHHEMYSMVSQYNVKYYIMQKRLCHLLSGVYHITRRRRKGRSLEVPSE